MNSIVAKILIVMALIAAVGVVLAIKYAPTETDVAGQEDHVSLAPADQGAAENAAAPAAEPKALPRLVDLGASKCVPCKMMAPILEDLKTNYADRLVVDFIDVWENPDQAPRYGIRVIPTQIFFDPQGKELFRHEGFFSKEDILAKWKEFGFDFTDGGTATAFERLEPAKPDTRPRDRVCYLCDKNIQPRALVTVQTDKGPVRLCSPHCYFIMYSCLTEDKADFERRVTFTDWSTGQPVPMADAICLYGQDEQTGRPWIKTFADRDQAVAERAESGGNLLALATLQEKELSHRCGFCDRACYPQDAARVLVADGLQTWGCCSHCALGVAARTGKDIEVHERDRLTGDEIVVKTFDGAISALEPKTAVAWFGQRKKPDGTWGSAGCFHQGFFVNADNLKQWVEKNPYETGRMIPIAKALADKMKLSPEQIKKACKIGECVPK